MSLNLRRDTLHSPLAYEESQAAVKGDNFNKESRADRPVNQASQVNALWLC